MGRGKVRQIFDLELAFIGFGTGLQCFRHARLRNLAGNAQIGLVGFHQKRLRQRAKRPVVHGRLGVSDGVRGERGDAASQILDKGRQLVRWKRGPAF